MNWKPYRPAVTGFPLPLEGEVTCRSTEMPQQALCSAILTEHAIRQDGSPSHAGGPNPAPLQSPTR